MTSTSERGKRFPRRRGALKIFNRLGCQSGPISFSKGGVTNSPDNTIYDHKDAYHVKYPSKPPSVARHIGNERTPFWINSLRMIDPFADAKQAPSAEKNCEGVSLLAENYKKACRANCDNYFVPRSDLEIFECIDHQRILPRRAILG
jgi:hypothetical protein